MMDSTFSGTAAWWDFPGASASRWVFSSIHLHFPSNREVIGRVLLFFYPRKHSLPSCGHNFFPLVKGFLAVLCSCTQRPFPCWQSDLDFFCKLLSSSGKYSLNSSHSRVQFTISALWISRLANTLCTWPFLSEMASTAKDMRSSSVAISHFQLNSFTLSVLARFSCLWVFADKTTRSGLQA